MSDHHDFDSKPELSGFIDIDVARKHAAERRSAVAGQVAQIGNFICCAGEKCGGQFVSASHCCCRLSIKGDGSFPSASVEQNVDGRNVSHEHRFKPVQLVLNKFKSLFHKFLHRLVGPSDGRRHPAQGQALSAAAPGGSNAEEDRSDA